MAGHKTLSHATRSEPLKESSPAGESNISISNIPIILAFFLGSLTVYLPALVAKTTELVDNLNTCKLGSVCREGQKRPLLKDGSMSHEVWDKPRLLMETQFRRALGHVPFRDANVSFLSKKPLVLYFDNVIAEDEIDFLIDMATPRFKRSTTITEDGGLTDDDPGRTSDTAWLSGAEHPKILEIKERVTNLVGFHGEQSEDISINRYRKLPGQKGQEYGAHLDYIEDEKLESWKPCQRAATLLIYLTDVPRGGETAFFRDGWDRAFDENNPIHIKVTPRRGRVLAWFNCHPYTEKPDWKTLHAGLPVEEGEKLAATFFVRNCTLYDDEVIRLGEEHN